MEKGKFMREIKRVLKDIYHKMRFSYKKRIIDPCKMTKSKSKYIVFRESNSCGLFSLLMTTMGQIAYADAHGMIPEIDFKNHNNIYLEEELLGKENAWEYYFKQPYDGILSKDEVDKVREKVICRDENSCCPTPTHLLFDNCRGELDYFRKLCKSYIKLSDEAEAEFILAQQQLFSGKKNILGVLARGTDFLTLKPKGHSIQPDLQTQLFPKIDDMISSDGYEWVYLATEDKKIIEKFQDKYGEKLLFYDREYIPYNYSECENIATYTSQMKSSKKQQGMDYLMQIMLLTKCQGFVGGITSGSICVACLANEWKNTYVFDLGTY